MTVMFRRVWIDKTTFRSYNAIDARDVENVQENVCSTKASVAFIFLHADYVLQAANGLASARQHL